MPRHTLKLLALMTIFSVAPAAAGHRVFTGSAALHHGPECPYERARAEAAARAAAAQLAAAAPKGPITITLVEGVPSERPLRNAAPGAYFTP